MEHLYSYHLALVSNSGLTEDSFKSVQGSAKENFGELMNVSRPWAKSTEQFQDVREELVQGWKEVWGEDINDPEVLATWKKDMEGLANFVENRMSQESEQDTDARKFALARKRVIERRARTFRKRNQ